MSTQVPLSDILRVHAARDPGRPAVTQDGVTVTRHQLDERSTCRARHLAREGVASGDVVLLAVPNSIAFFEYTFAAWKLGAIPCPVSPRLPRHELEGLIALAKPSLIVGVQIDGYRCLEAGDPPDTATVELPDSPVSRHWKIMTSGGSTGRPKLIVTEAPALFPADGTGYLGQEPGGTILSPGPLYHNAAFSAAHHCLFSGGHVVCMARFDAEEALRLIDQHKVHHVVVVPTVMNRIWRLPGEVRNAFDISSLKTVVHLGAACPVWLKEAWIDWLGPERLLEVYAGTEGIGSTSIRGDEWLRRPGSVGKPTPGVRLRIADRCGRECAVGEIGEIQFHAGAAENLGFHYIGADPEIREGWVSLGDLGHVDGDGYLYISDRRTDMIVSGGVNLFPAEIEAAIDRHPAVRASVVIGLPDDDLGNRAHAIIQTEPGGDTLSTGQLVSFLRETLAGFKIPRTFEFTDANLKDEAGKVRRSGLRAERLAAGAHVSEKQGTDR